MLFIFRRQKKIRLLIAVGDDIISRSSLISSVHTFRQGSVNKFIESFAKIQNSGHLYKKQICGAARDGCIQQQVSSNDAVLYRIVRTREVNNTCPRFRFRRICCCVSAYLCDAQRIPPESSNLSVYTVYTLTFIIVSCVFLLSLSRSLQLCYGQIFVSLQSSHHLIELILIPRYYILLLRCESDKTTVVILGLTLSKP